VTLRAPASSRSRRAGAAGGAPLTLVLTTTLVLGAAVLTPTRATAAPSTGAGDQHVIVVLRDQPRTAGTTAPARAHRAALVRDSQAPVLERARALGARDAVPLSSVNAVALVADAAQVQALAALPEVSSVVPDRLVRLPQQERSAAVPRGTARPGVVGRTPASDVCPTDPARPLHEPEALQTMNVEGVDGSGGAHATTRGAGVRVGWIADGIDPQSPEFIRNGRSVFADYQDFTDDGPDAPTEGDEAFGDASAIAAQGNQTYDLSDYVNEAVPLPRGCTITVTGVAPGADLVGLKVIGADGAAPTSRIVQAIDYAVGTAQVDVLNESFGQNFFPDGTDDPIALANSAAVRAGVTVVASSGDAGITGTFASPATSPDVIAVGATTTFRAYRQTGLGFTTLPGVTGTVSGNISALSSAGLSQAGRVVDVVAPGDENWAACSTDQQRFTSCADQTTAARPSPIELFGGTSQSAPLTAGVAALVISAYRTAHPGRPDPSPALVKRIITSTAHDLGHPAELQGSGQVDAQAAVRAALSVPAEGTSTAPASLDGSTLLADRSQVDLSGKAGSTVAATVRVTNVSSASRTVSATVRALTKTLQTRAGSVRLDAAAARRSAVAPQAVGAADAAPVASTQDITVLGDTDRLDVNLAWADEGTEVEGVLIDPHGVYSAYSLPQGAGNYGHLSVAAPAPGRWRLVVIGPPDLASPVRFDVTQRAYRNAGSVKLSRPRLSAGRSTDVTAKVRLPEQPGDLGVSLRVKADDGTRTTVALALRGRVPTSRTGSTHFAGTITGGNGRSAPAQSSTYDLDVPRGRPALSVGVHLTGQQDPETIVVGYLVSPRGQPLAAQSDSYLRTDGVIDGTPGVQLFARAPEPGRWRLVLQVLNPVEGNRTRQPFTGTVSLTSPKVSASGALPRSARTVLPVGAPVAVRVRVTNTGVVPRSFFADPRLETRGTYTLASQTPGDDQQKTPLGTPAQWLVPSRSDTLSVTAASNQPVRVSTSWGAGLTGGAPQVLGTTSVTDTSTATVVSPRLAPGPWSATASPLRAPSSAPVPGDVAYTATVRTQLFDPAVTTSTGSLWAAALVQAPAAPDARSTAAAGSLRAARAGTAPARLVPGRTADAGGSAATAPFAPLTLQPGQSGTISVVLTPRGEDRGRTVRGTLDVGSADTLLGTGDEVASLPYAYTVG